MSRHLAFALCALVGFILCFLAYAVWAIPPLMIDEPQVVAPVGCDYSEGERYRMWYRTLPGEVNVTTYDIYSGTATTIAVGRGSK